MYLTRVLLSLAVTGVLFACSGPLKVNYAPSGAPLEYAGHRAVVIEGFADRRTPPPTSDPRSIGRATALVSDMSGADMVLSEDVSALVERAFRQELERAGFTVKGQGDKTALVVSGEVRRFAVDVGPRDTAEIELFVRFKEQGLAEPLWSGVVSEKSERYAGVMGNSRKTLSDYISASLSSVVRKSIANASPHMGKGALSEDEKEATPAVIDRTKGQGMGKAALTSEPSRAKVHINGVYYGLTPMTVELEQGVYSVRFAKDGFGDMEERIAVRNGYTVEIEAVLKKK